MTVRRNVLGVAWGGVLVLGCGSVALPGWSAVYQWRQPVSGSVETLGNWGLGDPAGPVPTVLPGPADVLAISADSFANGAYSVSFTQDAAYQALYTGRAFTGPNRDEIILTIGAGSGGFTDVTVDFQNAEFGGDDATVRGTFTQDFTVNTNNTTVAFDVSFEEYLTWNTGTLEFKRDPSGGEEHADLSLSQTFMTVTGSSDVRLGGNTGLNGETATQMHTLRMDTASFQADNATVVLEVAPSAGVFEPLQVGSAAGFFANGLSIGVEDTFGAGAGLTGGGTDGGLVRAVMGPGPGGGAIPSGAVIGGAGVEIGRDASAPTAQPGVVDAEWLVRGNTSAAVNGDVTVNDSGRLVIEDGSSLTVNGETTQFGRFGVFDVTGGQVQGLHRVTANEDVNLSVFDTDVTHETGDVSGQGFGAVSVGNGTLRTPGVDSTGRRGFWFGSGGPEAQEVFVFDGGQIDSGAMRLGDGASAGSPSGQTADMTMVAGSRLSVNEGGLAVAGGGPDDGSSPTTRLTAFAGFGGQVDFPDPTIEINTVGGLFVGTVTGEGLDSVGGLGSSMSGAGAVSLFGLPDGTYTTTVRGTGVGASLVVGGDGGVSINEGASVEMLEPGSAVRTLPGESLRESGRIDVNGGRLLAVASGGPEADVSARPNIRYFGGVVAIGREADGDSASTLNLLAQVTNNAGEFELGAGDALGLDVAQSDEVRIGPGGRLGGLTGVGDASVAGVDLGRAVFAAGRVDVAGDNEAFFEPQAVLWGVDNTLTVETGGRVKFAPRPIGATTPTGFDPNLASDEALMRGTLITGTRGVLDLTEVGRLTVTGLVGVFDGTLEAFGPGGGTSPFPPVVDFAAGSRTQIIDGQIDASDHVALEFDVDAVLETQGSVALLAGEGVSVRGDGFVVGGGGSGGPADLFVGGALTLRTGELPFGAPDFTTADAVVGVGSSLTVDGPLTIETFSTETPDATLTLQAGSSLTVFGAFRGASVLGSGAVELAGVVSPGAASGPIVSADATRSIQLGGSFALTDSSTTMLDVNGSEAGAIGGFLGPAGYDQLRTAGTAEIDGDLVLTLDEFAPAVGDVFVLVDAVSVVGAFDTVSLVDVDGWGDGGTPRALAVTYETDRVLATAALFGDANLNGQVEQADLDAVLTNWGRSNATAGSGPKVSWATGDFDGDGFVAQADLDAVLTNWGSLAAPSFALNPARVPEPGAAVLVVLLTALTRRKGVGFRSGLR